METIWKFVQEMTVWNWMSLVAFLILPFTALNVFFSLRERFKNWLSLRNKKSFQKRLKQLENRIFDIERYYTLNHLAIADYIYEFLFIFLFLQLALLMFLIGYAQVAGPIAFIRYIPYSLSLIIYLIAMYLTNRLLHIFSDIGSPFYFVKKGLKLINTGHKKQFITQEETNKLVKKMQEIDLFSESGKQRVQKLQEEIFNESNRKPK